MAILVSPSTSGVQPIATQDDVDQTVPSRSIFGISGASNPVTKKTAFGTLREIDFGSVIACHRCS
jgi:hypothetical protein